MSSHAIEVRKKFISLKATFQAFKCGGNGKDRDCFIGNQIRPGWIWGSGSSRENLVNHEGNDAFATTNDKTNQ